MPTVHLLGFSEHFDDNDCAAGFSLFMKQSLSSFSKLYRNILLKRKGESHSQLVSSQSYLHQERSVRLLYRDKLVSYLNLHIKML